MIGSLCKVFWDGEDEWFYARILYYDKRYDRHLVYYYNDSTVEWLVVRDEYVYVAETLVMARMRYVVQYIVQCLV